MDPGGQRDGEATPAARVKIHVSSTGPAVGQGDSTDMRKGTPDSRPFPGPPIPVKSVCKGESTAACVRSWLCAQ